MAAATKLLCARQPWKRAASKGGAAVATSGRGSSAVVTGVAVVAAGAKEPLAQEKAQASSSINQEVDLDELMDDPELEKLHAERIATLKLTRKKLKRDKHWRTEDMESTERLLKGISLVKSLGVKK